MLVNRKISGFTLFELMIALSIGSVILVVGVPSFRGVLDNQRMTAATNEMVMSLNLAKSEAIKRVAYVSVCKSSNGTSCTPAASWDDGWIVYANATLANLGTVDVGDEIIRVYPALRDDLVLTSLGAVDPFLSFRPGGTLGTAVANMTGTLTICDQRGAASARGVVLDSSGRWRVSRTQDHAGGALTC